ncbi:MAG: LL-diaminopimelate aminotransferase [Clostridia bacterium]|nr:LL-diaminopimelate aminotransferase [Clostridia bacterium]
MRYNENFNSLPDSYVFAKMNEKVAEMKKSGKEIINLGIGDVKLPLFPVTVEAMKRAAGELSGEKTFKGYMPAEGLTSLREKIAAYYSSSGVKVETDEIFVSDGIKSEIGNILELFGAGAKVLIPEPSYPAYAEANIIYGNEVDFLPTFIQDGFIPSPPYGKIYDIFFLCSPNNPTGAVLSYKDLKAWIDYAISSGAVIIFDGAYSFFTEGGYPKSIYEVSGAKDCAIELRSFSKSFGFTGVRCGYTVIPKRCKNYNSLCRRRLGARFNGVSYITQRGAETFFSSEGQKFAKRRADYYKANAEILKTALKKRGVSSFAGNSSPYVFSKCPEGFTSESFCEKLLVSLGIVATPGNGFGFSGEGYFRLSAFLPREEILKAHDLIANSAFFGL